MRSGRFWPAFVVALIAGNLALDGVLVYLALSDPSFAVEKDYYAKALDWDAKRAQDRRNEVLGWSVDVAVGDTVLPDGQAEVTVRLADRSGDPVASAAVHLEAFHNARAATILQADLAPRGDGVYSTRLPLRRPGLWEFRVEVNRGEERFTGVLTQDVAVPR